MAIPVYDFRTDVRNVLVTPQIRARFLRMEPGQEAALHSHDLGHEIFLVLAGRAEFEVATDGSPPGETVVLGPGQMCAVLADQPHRVRVVGDEPMTMYLSVTPHVQPTHTGRTEEGGRLPLRFMPSRAYDLEEDESVPLADLLDRQVAAAEAVASAAQECAEVQRAMAARLAEALAAGNAAAAAAARAAMWEAVYAVYRSVSAMAEVWNGLAPRCAEAE
jgi:quercetin dioxygenase-like cupin family protein